jgi:hypothetical protein
MSIDYSCYPCPKCGRLDHRVVYQPGYDRLLVTFIAAATSDTKTHWTRS